MQKTANPKITNDELGLWGDIFCIQWLSKWLNIGICVWSSTMGKKYLHFNEFLTSKPYSLLFHDVNPVSGHFEPLIQSITPNSQNQQQLRFSQFKKSIRNTTHNQITRNVNIKTTTTINESYKQINNK